MIAKGRNRNITTGSQNNRDAVAVAQTAVKRHGATQEALVSVLSEINDELGYLPAEAMAEASRLLGMPRSQLVSAASFYSMLSTTPKGRHVVHFCESAPCHVEGGREVWQRLQEELGLQAGHTSADGKWTLLTTSCLGICGIGPVVTIDDDVYGNVEPERLPDILARYA